MKKFIILILLLGLILRLIALNQSLWLDEAIGAIVVKNQTLFQIITEFIKHDNHPPLYYLTLKLWSGLFGYSEVSLRSLSVLFGLGTIFLTYKFGEKLSKNVGIIGAILMATSQFHIYYSQETRMYSMAAFLGILAFYMFLEEKWLYFSIALTALVFTDYVPVFLLPVFWIIGIIGKKPKKWWRNLVLSHVPLLILGILWLPTFVTQSQGGKWLIETLPAWIEVAGGATPKRLALVWAKFVFGRISLNDKVLYYLLVAIFSVPCILVLVKAWRERKKIMDLWFYLLVPLFLGFLASIFFPAFIYFRFLYVLPAFFLLIAWGLSRYKGRVRIVIFMSIILGNLVSWFIYIDSPSQQREQWREAVKFVEIRANPGEITAFNFTEPFAPYQWYSQGKIPAIGLTDSISANTIQTRKKTALNTQNVNGVYYFEYLWELHDPQKVVINTLKEQDFIEAAAFDFPGVGIIRYLRKI